VVNPGWPYLFGVVDTAEADEAGRGPVHADLAVWPGGREARVRASVALADPHRDL